MATDLNAILKAKKVEDQFAQYFMYQIMVSIIQNHTEHQQTNILSAA
jgi:p38 MAP kinase